MKSSVSAFPLQWPKGRPRGSPTSGRLEGKFTAYGAPITVARALSRLQAEVGRLGGTHAVISTNFEMRLDGLPRANQPEPTDRGVALYFQLHGKPHCMPCDTYTRVAQNIAAIAAHISATRAIQRYGVATIDELFAGFIALPASAGPHWSDILGVKRTATREEIETAHRQMAKKNHPDAGGSNDMMAKINTAKAAALAERG